MTRPRLIYFDFAGSRGEECRIALHLAGIDFEDVREYQPGDEIRAIDWNVTARLGNAFVKKFTEERELTVMLVVDVSASGNFGSVALSKRELAAEVACLLAGSEPERSAERRPLGREAGDRPDRVDVPPPTPEGPPP